MALENCVGPLHLGQLEGIYEPVAPDFFSRMVEQSNRSADG